MGSRIEHVAYYYNEKNVYLINHSLDLEVPRITDVELIDLNGSVVEKSQDATKTMPDTSKRVSGVPSLDMIKDVASLRLRLWTAQHEMLSRNFYWLGTTLDELHRNRSTWFHIPVSSYADFTALNDLTTASVSVTLGNVFTGCPAAVTLRNEAEVPAFFIWLNLVDEEGEDIAPIL